MRRVEDIELGLVEGQDELCVGHIDDHPGGRDELIASEQECDFERREGRRIAHGRASNHSTFVRLELLEQLSPFIIA